MTTENQSISRQRSRWLRAALLAYTLTSPAIRAWLERISERSQADSEEPTTEEEQTEALAKQVELRERLEELTQESRQRVVEQVEHLRAQARQLRTQSRQLRKAVRREARQRRKLLAQLSKAGSDWSQDMLKRGERLSDELVERSGKASHELVERSEKVARELAKRGRKMTKNLAERGEALLKPQRKQNRIGWAAAGFGVGLIIAGVITYRLVRGRAAQLLEEKEQSIELPQDGAWNATPARPAGEIRHLDQSGTTVATLEVVEVAGAERAPDAAFVGIVSSQFYYPIGTDLAVESTDLVYFITEEEARGQGFKAAE